MDEDIILTYFHLKDEFEVDELLEIKKIKLKIRTINTEFSEISMNSNVIESTLTNIPGTFVWETKICLRELLEFNLDLQFELFVKFENPREFSQQTNLNLNGFLKLNKGEFKTCNFDNISILKINSKDLRVSAFKNNEKFYTEKNSTPLLNYFTSLKDVKKYDLLMDKFNKIEISLDVVQNLYNRVKTDPIDFLSSISKVKFDFFFIYYFIEFYYFMFIFITN